MVQFRIGECVVSVERGDITQIQVDAIVNPANSRLIMGGGVAGAIKRAGGIAIEEEAVRRAPVAVGEAVVTTAGKLQARYVIHAPTMSRPAMNTDLTSVEKATTAALRAARQLRLSSIAVPGMGTGVGGVPVQEAAQTMVEAIRRHLSEGTTLKHVVLMSIDDALTGAFESVLR
ncbi:macro domain-containing protein, partial [[Eubacterium] cellulosolvens]